MLFYAVFMFSLSYLKSEKYEFRVTLKLNYLLVLWSVLMK